MVRQTTRHRHGGWTKKKTQIKKNRTLLNVLRNGIRSKGKLWDASSSQLNSHLPNTAIAQCVRLSTLRLHRDNVFQKKNSKYYHSDPDQNK